MKINQQTTVKAVSLNRTARLKALKVAIQEGLDSGMSNKTVKNIMEEVEARLRVGGHLYEVNHDIQT